MISFGCLSAIFYPDNELRIQKTRLVAGFGNLALMIYVRDHSALNGKLCHQRIVIINIVIFSASLVLREYIPVIFQVASLLAALAHSGHIVRYVPGDSLPCRRDIS
ncbi:hypothetical protein [Photorhabdus heterorhabditis]|uniref:hypothetical protein n=1 Tax=Photorhabdus heterorhabditis TaxID=880156 RepID=UPI001562C59A|nr:hypothetical protein [Photorhabdus heterorhabditis]NRN27532.1 hypothetical protein [Photorhabdus heterorhabditis subsp. aluminescens]